MYRATYDGNVFPRLMSRTVCHLQSIHLSMDHLLQDTGTVVGELSNDAGSVLSVQAVLYTLQRKEVSSGAPVFLCSNKITWRRCGLHDVVPIRLGMPTHQRNISAFYYVLFGTTYIACGRRNSRTRYNEVQVARSLLYFAADECFPRHGTNDFAFSTIDKTWDHCKTKIKGVHLAIR